MSTLEALLLGIVQGLTEFLPISSSGHLIIVPWLQDYTFLLENPEFNKTFDVALHAGTLVAAIAYFRRELVVDVVEQSNNLPFDKYRIRNIHGSARNQIPDGSGSRSFSVSWRSIHENRSPRIYSWPNFFKRRLGKDKL